jgi:polyisoprenoid-binding protein YceI
VSAPFWSLLLALSALGAGVTHPVPVVVRAGGPPDTLVANPGVSAVRWRATAFDGRTRLGGTARLARGMMVLRHEMLTSGSFTIDMGSVTTDRAENARTVDSHDAEAMRYSSAFLMKRYPTAVFTSSGMERIGPSRWRVSGALAMHGTSQPLSFDADVRWVETGHLVATTTLMIDRRRWGIAPRDSSIANRMVDDMMEVAVTLDARRRTNAVAVR